VDVLITEPDGFCPRAIELLRSGGLETHLYDGELAGVGDVIENYDGLIVRLGIHWSHELLARAKNLKFIGTPTTGLNHIDLDAAQDLRIDVVSLSGLQGLDCVTSTAEHAFGLLLALVRNTCAAHQSVLAGQWDRDSFTGRELRGKTVGVLGMGRLGRMFANLARAFQMRVVYYDPFVATDDFERCDSLSALAEQADVISIHVKLNAETVAFLGSAFFESCRPGAFLINTSRGELIDEDSLIDAIESGKLAGVALDVLSGEPETGQVYESPIIECARCHSNVILTPHVGGATLDAMRATEELLAVELVRRFC